jgi:pimeloyl-ACP methyl ester carboxylesterase
MTELRPFTVSIDQRVLDRIVERVRDYPWDAVPDAGGWNCGIGIGYLRELARYWVEHFDWRAQEARLNRLPQFMATVDSVDIHFYHVKGSKPGRALLLSHGWPGSIVEFLSVIEPLAHPERYGGHADDAFDVIVPSLPGFGFSGPPRTPIGPRTIASMFNTLMTDVLGYDAYLAQGGDWGAGIAAWLGFDHGAACRGIHLNMQMVYPAAQPSTDEERAWSAQIDKLQRAEGAYVRQQATKPQTLGLGLLDSPVGIAAWIVEKFAAWSDLPRTASGAPDLGKFCSDDLLANVMCYVATQRFPTSLWIYHAWLYVERSYVFPPARRCDVPTGFAAFPDPYLPPPPRSWIEKAYNLVHYTQMPRGGHFAALEAPDLFTEDVRKFARSIGS